MDYELNKLRLNPKEQEKLLLEALRRIKYNEGSNVLLRKIYQYRRKRFQNKMLYTYGSGSLGALLSSLKGRKLIDAPEGQPFKITERGKIVLKRGFVDFEPEKPYEKYMAWCGVAAIPIGLFSSEIRSGAKWIWQVLSDLLCRIF